jgi:hypothetical protein
MVDDFFRFGLCRPIKRLPTEQETTTTKYLILLFKLRKGLLFTPLDKGASLFDRESNKAPSFVVLYREDDI